MPAIARREHVIGWLRSGCRHKRGDAGSRSSTTGSNRHRPVSATAYRDARASDNPDLIEQRVNRVKRDSPQILRRDLARIIVREHRRKLCPQLGFRAYRHLSHQRAPNRIAASRSSR